MDAERAIEIVKCLADGMPQGQVALKGPDLYLARGVRLSDELTTQELLICGSALQNSGCGGGFQKPVDHHESEGGAFIAREFALEGLEFLLDLGAAVRIFGGETEGILELALIDAVDRLAAEQFDGFDHHGIKPGNWRRTRSLFWPWGS